MMDMRDSELGYSRLSGVRRYLLPFLLGTVFLLSVLSVGRIFVKQTLANAGYDLHPYWYYGHFVLAGHNPYQAYMERTPFRSFSFSHT
jgi:hypothetical protein